jgi:hypothetical protein
MVPRQLRNTAAIAAGIAVVLVMTAGLAACNKTQDTNQTGTAPLSDSESQSLETGADTVDTMAEAEVEPTIVGRLVPTETPTPDPADDPLYPIMTERLPGVPLPAAAVLVSYDQPSEESDIAATYVIEGVTGNELTDWFKENMVQAGWEEPEERDGALIFLHTTERSARFEDEDDNQRTATVFVDSLAKLEGGTTFTVIVEVPAEGKDQTSD